MFPMKCGIRYLTQMGQKKKKAGLVMAILNKANVRLQVIKKIRNSII